MSIPFNRMREAFDNYLVVKARVASVLGQDLLDIDHYGTLKLFNVIINQDTSKEDIKDIYDRYVGICRELKLEFKKHGLELEEKYFRFDFWNSTTVFMGEPINVYIGIQNLQPRIDAFFKHYHKHNKKGSLDRSVSYELRN